MGKIIKFINLLILFISMFLVVVDVNGKPFLYPFELSCLSYMQNISSPLVFVSYFFFIFLLLQQRERARRILIVECVIVFILLFQSVMLNIVAVAVLQICDKRLIL